MFFVQKEPSQGLSLPFFLQMYHENRPGWFKYQSFRHLLKTLRIIGCFCKNTTFLTKKVLIKGIIV